MIEAALMQRTSSRLEGRGAFVGPSPPADEAPQLIVAVKGS